MMLILHDKKQRCELCYKLSRQSVCISVYHYNIIVHTAYLMCMDTTVRLYSLFILCIISTGWPTLQVRWHLK